jgi:hypothetical protein
MSSEQKKFNKSLDKILLNEKELMKLNEDNYKTLYDIGKVLRKRDYSQSSEQKKINAYLYEKLCQVIKKYRLANV